MVVLASCKEEDRQSHIPVLQLIPSEGFAGSDTTMPPGGYVKIALQADGGGSNITYFGVRMYDGRDHFVLDSGLNHPNLSFSQYIFKGNSAAEQWTFTIMNHDRMKKSITITLSKAEVVNWGDIITYDPVILGAQENPGEGSFFSLDAAHGYNYAVAATNPGSVDLIYYYGIYESTLSSPAESDAPAVFPGIGSWTVLNETRYDTTILTGSDFNAAHNDSLLLVTYEPVNGKRKAKNLEAGMVVAFRNHSGRTGLLLVKQRIPGSNGNIECAIKVQP